MSSFLNFSMFWAIWQPLRMVRNARAIAFAKGNSRCRVQYLFDLANYPTKKSLLLLLINKKLKPPRLFINTFKITLVLLLLEMQFWTRHRLLPFGLPFCHARGQTNPSKRELPASNSRSKIHCFSFSWVNVIAQATSPKNSPGLPQMLPEK